MPSMPAPAQGRVHQQQERIVLLLTQLDRLVGRDRPAVRIVLIGHAPDLPATGGKALVSGQGLDDLWR